MTGEKILPQGESLRRAVRWLGELGHHDAAAIEEAARRFDLTPAEEEFLLGQFREVPPGRGTSQISSPEKS